MTQLAGEVSARFPGIALDPRLLEAVAQMAGQRRAEVYLCRAIEAGDTCAREHFELRFVQPLPVDDDVKQLVRQKLLTEPKRLAGYTGRGDLSQWLKAICARTQIDVQRAGREDAVEERVLDALMPDSSTPEVALLKRQARAALRDALHDALGRLDTRERLFVQHHYLDGLTLTAIGTMYAVAPSTVMRALDRVRHHLKDATIALLVERHGGSVESLVRAAGSHFEQ